MSSARSSRAPGLRPLIFIGLASLLSALGAYLLKHAREVTHGIRSIRDGHEHVFFVASVWLTFLGSALFLVFLFVRSLGAALVSGDAERER